MRAALHYLLELLAYVGALVALVAWLYMADALLHG